MIEIRFSTLAHKGHQFLNTLSSQGGHRGNGAGGMTSMTGGHQTKMD